MVNLSSGRHGFLIWGCSP